MTGRRTIAALSIASDILCREVAALVERCGFAVRRASSATAAPPADAAVVLVCWNGADATAMDAWIERASATATSWIAVLPRAAAHPRIASAAFDFLLWPAGPEEVGLRLHRLLADDANPIDEATEAFTRLNLVGRSPAFLDVLRHVERYARTQAAVLIEGPTGTGKELVARAIHYLGPRRSLGFVPINCGALQDALIEDELFGHEPGAFTDAKQVRQGVVAHAHGGTLFLDEIETLTPKGQVTLLRFLQDQEYRPVGSDRQRQADVRIVAASNVPLATLVGQQRFREDLHYRLDVLRLTLPPLSERREDIEPIARCILMRLRLRYGGPERTLAPGTLAWLQGREWRGNIRELENVLHRAYVSSDSAILTMNEATQPEKAAAFSLDFRGTRKQLVATFEREYLTWLLAYAEGNVSQAARMIGKERRALGRLIQRHGLASGAPRKPLRKLGA